MSTVADRIKEYRQKSGLSAHDAAEKLGVSDEIYNAWENGDGEPDTQTVFEMAELFGESADMILFGGEGRNAPLTMFPQSADPRFSPFADWRVLIGALMMFSGIGGILLLIMRAIGEGIETVSDMISYAGMSLLIFAVIFIVGLLLAVITAAVRSRKHKKEIAENGVRRFPWEKL